MKLRLRRLLASVWPAFGLARCSHCHMPWGNRSREPHLVEYAPGRGVFVVCEWCWPRTSVEERLRYAADLVFCRWEDADDWCAIESAFLVAR